MTPTWTGLRSMRGGWGVGAEGPGSRRAPAFWVALGAVLVLAAPGEGPLGAQEVPSGGGTRDRGSVGVFLGKASSRQIWSSSFSSDRLDGLALGAYVDVRTPVSFLSIRAEAGYVGRGSVVRDPDEDPERAVEASIRSHYLSVPVHGKATAEVGPLSATLFGGPTLDLLLDSGCSVEFCQVLREEKTVVFAVAVGAGVGLDLGKRLSPSFELRLTEGLSDSYLGAQNSARNRSVEMLVRVGKPL
jgi:hypothetical protein